MALGKVKGLATLLSASLFIGGVGCGDAGSNNDQGTSVTATGYFTSAEADEGETGRIVPLSSDIPTINAGAAPLDGQIVITYMQVLNRLVGQFVRLDRVDCDYTIAGASVPIPSDSFSVGAVIESGVQGGADGQITPSTGVVGFEVVSPDLFAFLNANRSSLPELPYRANATCFAVGVTQAGDTVSTNALNYTIQFGELSECCTGLGAGGGGGFQEGPGTGGDVDFFNSGEGNGAVGGAEGTEPTGTQE